MNLHKNPQSTHHVISDAVDVNKLAHRIVF